MVDLIGNLVFLASKAFILLFLLYVWYWLLAVEHDYITFVLLTIVMIAGAYCGAREARAEMG
jgi:uncharacterized membrane protein YfcA